MTSKKTWKSKNVSKKPKFQIPSGQYPVLVFGGEVSLQTQSGKLVRITLSTHEISPNVHEYTNQELKDVINKNISLGRFRNAWAICQVKIADYNFKRIVIVNVKNATKFSGINV